MAFRTIFPETLDPVRTGALLTGGVGPRPIALASTCSLDGVRNLAPFSFFNAFGANPPMVAFAPNRRGRDGTVKHTYLNALAVREFVIAAVSHAMVQQMNLASAEYPEGVDEFGKSGFTPLPARRVRPALVAESPFQMDRWDWISGEIFPQSCVSRGSGFRAGIQIMANRLDAQYC